VITQPTDARAVLARAAQIIALHGLHRGDYVADPFNRVSRSPHYLRPMSAVGALYCAVTRDPRTPSNLAWQALRLLADVVLVDGEPAWSDSIEDCDRHVDAWADASSEAHVVYTMRLLAGEKARRALTVVAA
jgi:hypothetical protein